MKYFCLPSDFKNETIDAYHKINSIYKNSKIIETYGQMAPDTVFGSCRVSRQLPNIDKNKLSEYIQHSHNKGIEFNYVLNTTTMEDDELTQDGYKKIRNFLRQLSEIGVDSITLSLPSLMEIAQYTVPHMKIKASTLCQVNSPSKAIFYESIGIKRIVLDEDIYRKFDVLKNIREEYGGELEIIVNSFCLNHCPYKMFHYNSLSFSHIDKELYTYYSSRCRNIHMGSETFMKLNWIRPEDLHYYEDVGITYFKIQGRTNVSTGEPVRAVTHYIEGSYDGDLVRLLELFSPKRPLAIAEAAIDNSKLTGFFDRFVNHPELCTKLCKKCGYCKSFGELSMNSVDRILMEISNTMNISHIKEFPNILET